MGQGGIAGAEVVERDTHAHVREALEQPPDGIRILQHGALGQLDVQKPRIGAGVLDDLLEDLDQVAVL